MSTPTVERAGDWDSAPFAGGFAGLRDLADDDFSGMVTAGPTRLFMTRGAVVGVLDGDIDDFAEGGGTAREAPHPALPLLAVMQERSDEVRAQYYTEETPLSEVDRTLSDGNFTGFVELAENVLSGDYYQVYHQGRSMSVAYVGASERLITDDEAFEQADDEVGIYEVRPVDVDIVEIPEPADDAPADVAPDDGPTDEAAGAAGGTALDSEDATAETDDDTPGEVDTSSEEPVDESGASSAEAGTVAEDDATAMDASSESDPSPSSGNEASDPDAEGAEGPVENATADEADADEPAGDESRPSAEPPSQTADSPPETDRSQPAIDDAPVETDRQASAPSADETTETGAGASTGTSPPATESTPTESNASTATGNTTADQAAGNATGESQQGQPAPDHPAAGRNRSGAGMDRQDAGGTEPSVGAADLEVHSLPSLDPSRTASASRQERARERRAAASGGAAGASSAPPGGSAAGAGSPGPGGSQPGTGQSTQPEPSDQRPAGPERNASGASDRGTPGQAASGDNAATEAETTSDPSVEDAGAGSTDVGESTADASESGTDGDEDATDDQAAEGEELAAARAEVERLEAELADLRGDHEAVVEERDRLESELAEAREEIERLRDRLEDATGRTSEAATKLSPREAIDETNLFIRYDSKGEATLEKAHGGEVEKTAVDENMRLEYHTSFEAAEASVDGVDFDTFLTDTVQYRFVDWLVRKLLYEIRDTDNTGPMADLYDALPKADRAELNGQVSVQYTEDGQEHRAQIGFDVIVRDRMGNPLIVANLNDSRDPATESMMTDLVRSAERVGESSSSLAGAFLVTRSFFEPGALETAEEATAGGLLNRGKQKSFVNLSRKGGYHLCLVEARNQEFHLAVPEL